MLDKNLIAGLIVLGLVVALVYMYAPKLRALVSGVEGFQAVSGSGKGPLKASIPTPGANPTQGGSMNAQQPKAIAANQHAKAAAAAPKASGEGFADYASVGDDNTLGAVPMSGAQKPAGCYPREQLNPAQLLPQDVNSQWAAANPAGTGDIQGKNFLSAGALIGVNTVGQSLRNANLQLRAEPACPQVQVSPWQQSTIEPDLQRRPLDCI